MDDRSIFAGLAMMGILASGHKDTLETITDDAVIAADMLIKALRDSADSLSPETPTGSVNPLNDFFEQTRTALRKEWHESDH